MPIRWPPNQFCLLFYAHFYSITLSRFLCFQSLTTLGRFSRSVTKVYHNWYGDPIHWGLKLFSSLFVHLFLCSLHVLYRLFYLNNKAKCNETSISCHEIILSSSPAFYRSPSSRCFCPFDLWRVTFQTRQSSSASCRYHAAFRLLRSTIMELYLSP